MINIFKKLKKRKKIFKAIIPLAVIAIFFVGLNYAMASDVGDAAAGVALFGAGTIGAAVAMILGLIALVLTTVIGLLITLVVAVLIQVAQYGSIINVPTVIQGWVIIRDLCNMSFILILLVIAFATILRQENFSAKKMLPKLLLMAILINFSRTIFGLMIDVSQIVMLTFVNAFAAGGGWFIQAFNTNFILSINGKWTSSDYAISSWSTAVAIIAGVLAAIITLIVVSVMLAILVARIVMLWIYTIFSPLVFLGFAFTPLQKYTGKIWEDFIKQLVVGPVLAFFIWLALTTASTSTASLMTGKNLSPDDEVCAGIGKFFCQGTFQQFIIVIGLLMGGLMVAQQMGGAAGSIAGKGLDWAKKSIGGVGKGTLALGGWGARKIKMGAVSEMLATKEVGEDGKVSWKGRVPGLGLAASALYGLEVRPAKIVEGIREGLKSKAEREEAQGIGASAVSLKKGGVGGLIKGLGVSRDLTEAIAGPGGLLWHKGFSRVFKATVGGGREKTDAKEKELEKFKADRGITQTEYDFQQRENEENLRRKSDESKETTRKRDDAARSGNNAEAAELNNIWKKQRADLFTMKAKNDNDLKTMEGKIVKDKVRKEQDEEINRMEKDLKLRRPIQTFYADRARDELIKKASSTLGDNDNEEFLVSAFQDALINGNKEVAQAVMIHAASVGHLNEIIQGYKSKENVYDEHNKLLVKKGEALPAGGYGLHELVKQALIEDLKIDDQTAYAAQSEVSTIAKSVNHQNMAESIGTKNGLLYQRKIEGSGGQLARARGEARKVDSEKYVRNYNRLAWGDEFEVNGKRQFRLNALGLDTFTEMADVLNKEIANRRLNKNAAMNIAKHDSETLLAWASKLEENGQKYYDESKKAADGTNLHSYVDLAKRLIEYGINVANAQQKDTIGGDVKTLQEEVLKQQKRPT